MRKPYFTRVPLPPEDQRSARPGTLRAECEAALLEGCTLERVAELCERGTHHRRPARAAAYEMVHLMHTDLGYGIKHDRTSGLIRIYR